MTAEQTLIARKLAERAKADQAWIDDQAKRAAILFVIKVKTAGLLLNQYTTDQLTQILAILDDPQL